MPRTLKNEPNIFGHYTPSPEAQALEAKREYNIRLREERYDKKQQELAQLRRQRKEAEADRKFRARLAIVESRQRELDDGIAQKQSSMEDSYRERNREAAIARREEAWQNRMHEYISNLLDTYQDQLELEGEKRTAAKEKILMRAKAEAKARADKKQHAEMMEEKRAEEMRKRVATRLAKEMVHCDELKETIEEEIEYKYECIENNVPTKVTMNDMVKSLVPVPTISELFCAVKSELDEIKYLKTVELEPLAKLAGVPPLIFVRSLNEAHEKGKLPIPTAIPITQY